MYALDYFMIPIALSYTQSMRSLRAEYLRKYLTLNVEHNLLVYRFYQMLPLNHKKDYEL